MNIKDSIVIFSTTWGSRYGGIDSFNYDLCIALSKLLRSQRYELKLVCLLSEDNSTEEEIQAAESLDIECIVIPEDLDNRLVTKILKEKTKPVCVLGHDVHTGQRAIDLAKYYKVKSAVFHHMNYQAYHSDQTAIRKQQDTLKNADLIFGVGPTLEDSAKTILNGVKDESCVAKVIPGISLKQNIASKPPPNFSAITLGRVNLENDLVKQIRLAVASFGQAVRKEPYNIKKKQPSLTVIGVSEQRLEETQESLRRLAKDNAYRRVPVVAWPYEKDRRVLFDELVGKTVCMVLSWYEGFSLVGLEAISAGVPLILSENTGLYRAIEEEFKGEGLGCIKRVDICADEDSLEEDLKRVTNCLSDIAAEPEVAKSNALELRKKLAQSWTWEETAKQVLKKLDIIGTKLNQDVSEFRKRSENQISSKTESENSSDDSLISDIDPNVRSFSKETIIKNSTVSISNDNQKHYSKRRRENENVLRHKVSPLIPREIDIIQQKLLKVLKIVKTLKEKKVISEAYSQYLIDNRLIASNILQSLEEMSFQVDLTWWNTALKLAGSISAEYNVSLNKIKGRKITNQEKWNEIYHELLELKNHLENLFYRA